MKHHLLTGLFIAILSATLLEAATTPSPPALTDDAFENRSPENEDTFDQSNTDLVLLLSTMRELFEQISENIMPLLDAAVRSLTALIRRAISAFGNVGNGVARSALAEQRALLSYFFNPSSIGSVVGNGLTSLANLVVRNGEALYNLSNGVVREFRDVYGDFSNFTRTVMSAICASNVIRCNFGQAGALPKLSPAPAN